MPGKAQYNTRFTSIRSRGRRAPADPAPHETAENVVRFHGTGADCRGPSPGTAPLPLGVSAATLHTDLECLPIAVVAREIWPFMNEIPERWTIANFKDLYKALGDWNEFESQAAQDAHNFLRLQDPGRRVAWAIQLGAHAQLVDFRVAGLSAHPSNHFWVRRLALPYTEDGLMEPQAERQLESLRVAMEIIMLRLFPLSLQTHCKMLEALNSLENAKGFADPRQAQADALRTGIYGVNFTLPAYPQLARNSIRIHIIASAAEALAIRYPARPTLPAPRRHRQGR